MLCGPIAKTCLLILYAVSVQILEHIQSMPSECSSTSCRNDYIYIIDSPYSIIWGLLDLVDLVDWLKYVV